MADLGPRSCRLCGPTIEGCWRCTSTVGHRHVLLVSRRGRPDALVAACDLHAPPPGADPSGDSPTAAGPTQTFVRDAKRHARKLAYDRARRRALAQLREAHRDEYERLLGEATGDQR